MWVICLSNWVFAIGFHLFLSLLLANYRSDVWFKMFPKLIYFIENVILKTQKSCFKMSPYDEKGDSIFQY